MTHQRPAYQEQTKGSPDNYDDPLADDYEGGSLDDEAERIANEPSVE